MRAFHAPSQAAHAPSFFLQRGHVRRYLETPARAAALLAACQDLRLDVSEPPAVAPDALRTVHMPAYLAFLAGAWAAWEQVPDHGPEMIPTTHPTPEMVRAGSRPPQSMVGQLGWFTTDTSCPITAGTWDASLGAAACALAAAEEAAQGRNVYALCRPPGHHAYPARAGGHCFINNAALAAEHLRTRGAARVAVLDIDAHHGNGTQGTFWERDDVLFVSLHGDPAHYYPWFVGYADERGGGAGEGFTRNLPLPAGTGDVEWLAALDAGCAAVRAFGAEALVLSLGFDASEAEPLRFLSVSDDGFARAGEAISRLRLPTAVIQEGGYNVDRIGPLLGRFLSGMGAA